MKNKFTKLFTLLFMAALSMGVMAETAILNWKIGEGGADATSANSVTGAAGTLAPGFTIDMPDNTTKTLSGGGWITHSETNYKSIKNSKGQRVRVQLPSGYEAQEVTLYVYANGSNDATLSNFNGSAASDVVPSTSDNEHPVVITKSLENETSFDFTFSGEQVCFIAVISYRAQPTGDSYTFGYEATLDGTNLSALAKLTPACANVTTSALTSTYEGASNIAGLSHGDVNSYTAASAYKNKANGKAIKTQNGEEDGAENHGAEISFQLTIATGYQLSLNEIASDLYVKSNRNNGFEYIIMKGEDVLYASPAYAIANGATSGHSKTVALKADAVRNLTGEITIKLLCWVQASSDYFAVSDFKATGLVSEIPGEGIKTSTLVRQEEETWVVNKTNDNKYAPEFSAGEATITIKRGDNGEVKCNEKGIRILSGMTIEVAVPEGSYIDEVAFYNYGEGNNTNDYAFNLSVNTESEQVGTLQATKSGDYHAWNSGEMRESELTFRQEEGYGDFYLREIRVTYRLKPATTTYTRVHPHMNLNTLCYPYQIDSYTGATFYTMLYKVVESTEVTEVVLQEHEGVLEAGKPYFYVPEGTELVCNYSGAYTAAGNDGNGVYGSYTDLNPVTNGMYVTYNNQIIKAGDNVKLREFRAYINMDEVSLQSGANLVPGRRQLRIASVPQQTTGIESQELKANSQKLIKNGQLYIMYNGQMYNVQGQLVK